jgi:mono/diheme cytochrome c family protein
MRQFNLVFASSFLLTVATMSQAQPKRDAGGIPAPTEALERGRTVYVLSSCHFCHGIDLTGAAMGAADLMHSKLVGSDRNGALIGPIVKAGLPNLQTAMPQYPDYTAQQISDLASYIHYLRQAGRYKQLTHLEQVGAADANAGKQYFNATGKCSGCHSTGNMAAVIQKYDAPTLLSRLLRPGPDNATLEGASPGLAAHLKQLELYSDNDVRNLLAYLETLKH